MSCNQTGSKQGLWTCLPICRRYFFAYVDRSLVQLVEHGTITVGAVHWMIGYLREGDFGTACRPTMWLQRLKKFRGAHRQGRSQSADIEQSNVALTSLDAAQIAARQSALEGKRLLRHAGLAPQLSQLPTKDDARVRLADRSLGCWHSWGIYESDSFESTLYK